RASAEVVGGDPRCSLELGAGVAGEVGPAGHQTGHAVEHSVEHLRARRTRGNFVARLEARELVVPARERTPAQARVDCARACCVRALHVEVALLPRLALRRAARTAIAVEAE